MLAAAAHLCLPVRHPLAVADLVTSLVALPSASLLEAAAPAVGAVAAAG